MNSGSWGGLSQEFGKLTCKVQHDLYHRFTADVHVLHCITVLDEVFQGKRDGSQQYLDAIEKMKFPDYYT
jgi:[protein-PII] uridylyltransferase